MIWRFKSQLFWAIITFMSIYQEFLLDHYKNPCHYGQLAQADRSIVEANPLCGDLIEITAEVRNGQLVRAAFVGEGCVVSQAMASVTLQHCCGRAVAEISDLKIDELLAPAGLSFGPNRLQCAVLALIALQKLVR